MSVSKTVGGGSNPSRDANAGRQVMGPPAAFQAEDRGVRLSLPAPFKKYHHEKNRYSASKSFH